MYINCHTYNSLRYGTLTVERLSELAAAAGVERLVLTDINNTTGIPDFVRECRSRDITPAAGIEFRDGNRLLYIGIARNNEGFRELNEFLTHHNVTGEPLPPRPPSFPNAYVIYPADGGNSTGGSKEQHAQDSARKHRQQEAAPPAAEGSAPAVEEAAPPAPSYPRQR
ncbi:MAG: PHP domain-containing protein [Bacteroidales bacterium]|nr:PHP domain-containing protein [Bacteroidales bacterium]